MTDMNLWIFDYRWSGYIGSTIVQPVRPGHTPIILDNLLLAAGITPAIFLSSRVADRQALQNNISGTSPISSCDHCAPWLWYPSRFHPYDYYTDNVANSLELSTTFTGWVPRGVFSSWLRYLSVRGMVKEQLPDTSSLMRYKYMMEMIWVISARLMAWMNCAAVFNPMVLS